MITLTWTPAAIPGLLAMATAFVLGGIVYAVAPERARNRWLALMLAFEGFRVSVWAFHPLFVEVRDSRAILAVNMLAAVGLLVCYLGFLATIDSPLTRPLRTRTGRIARWVLASFPLLWLTNSSLLIAGMAPSPIGGHIAAFTPFGTAYFLTISIVPIYALVVAISLFRESVPGSLARRQAVAFILAFGLKDGFALLRWAGQIARTIDSEGGLASRMGDWFVTYVPPWDAFLFSVLLAYGILRTQLFDLDLRIKVAVRQSTLMAMFAAAFFFVSEGLADLFSAALGRWIGLGVTAGLLIFISPLQRVAERLSSAAVPGADPRKIDARRYEVYRAALDEAIHTGDEPDEAPVLVALRKRLGVTDNEHHVLRAAAEAEAVRRGLAPGKRFMARYQVTRLLGRGSSGEVFLARDLHNGCDVAIKRLAGDRLRDASALARFRDEADLASALDHPNIVAVHDFAQIGSDAYLVMEYVRGGSLQDRLDREGPLREPEARRVIADVLAALGALHEGRIVHRDVKPANILLDASGRAKLSDFTVARGAVSGETVGAGDERPAGTWAFMAPEQARGLPATPRSDLYSAAATLYAALAGRPPIALDEGDDRAARLRIAREAPALPIPGVSERTNAALARGLAKSPGERFANAEEFAAALAPG